MKEIGDVSKFCFTGAYCETGIHVFWTGALYIRILEYNDQAPVFDLPFYNLSVLEERPLSTVIGSVLARDEDDQIQAYQLQSNPGELFTISGSSGRSLVRLHYTRLSARKRVP